jgi:monoamine oxidase
MPRTPLLRTLYDLARDFRIAEALGVTPDEVQRRRREARASGEGAFRRREFLKKAAAGGLGAILAPTLLGRVAKAASAPRIAVIGGGISGLAAALQLSDAGYGANVTVYEASGRIGGRMFSNSPQVNGTSYWNDGQCTEWCGELVDSGHVTIQTLAARFLGANALADLVAAEPAGSQPTYFFNGGYYTLAQVTSDFAGIYLSLRNQTNGAIPAKLTSGPNAGAKNVDATVLYNAITPLGVQLDNTSLYDWIEQNIPHGHGSNFGALLDAAYASEFGADSTDQTCLNMMLMLAYPPQPKQWAAFGPSDERYHIRGGNQLLPLAIASHLGSSVVKTGYRLTSIAQNGDGTLQLGMSTATGAVNVTADYVILTLPFAVLADSVDYSQAGFNTLKTQAIQNLGRGLCSKLQLQFTSRMWEQPGVWGAPNDGEEVFSDNGDQCSWEPSRGQAGASGIMNSYTGGTPTVERANLCPVAFSTIDASKWTQKISGISQTFVGELNEIFPGIAPLWNGKATISLPHLAPNFKLAYSYWRKGQYQWFAGYERVPQGLPGQPPNCFFGGEHTSVNFQGFMEGGAAEGQRAANEVLATIAASH